MASRSAPALPTFRSVSCTCTPVRLAISGVSSVDPSDTTWILPAGTSCMMASRLAPSTAASLCAGIRTATSSTDSEIFLTIWRVLFAPGRMGSATQLAARGAGLPLRRRVSLAANVSASRTMPIVPQMAKLKPSTNSAKNHHGITAPPTRCC